MIEDYTVAVKVKLFNEVSGGLMLMSRQFEGLTDKALIFQGHLSKIKGLMTASFGMLGGAAALGAPFLYAITKASELQKQMIGIQIATHGTTQQMDAMRAAMERASSNTMFSTLDVANMGKIIATANSFNASQVTSVLPEYAKFADVQLLLKGTDYKTSVSEAVKLAHQAKIYDPAGLAKYLDTLSKASLLSSGNISELGHALKYSQSMGQSILGIDPNQMVILAAFANRLGLSGSRGGTNMIDALGRSIPGVFGSGLLKGKSYEALSAMGMVDSKGYSKFFTDGKFDPFSFIQGVAHYATTEMAKDPKHGRQEIYKNLVHALGIQGSRFAALLTSPAALEMLKQMEVQFETSASNSGIQDKYVTGSVSQQFQTSLTNFQNAMIELGWNLLPLATHVLNDVNHELSVLIPWMRDHKQLIKDLSVAFLGLATAMAFGGIVTGLTAAFVGLSTVLRGILAITGVSTASAGLAGAGAGLAARTAAMGLTLTGVGAAGFAGYEVGSWLNDKFNLSQKIGGGLYDWTHPNANNINPVAPSSSQAIQVTTINNLDGKEIYRNTTMHAGIQAQRQQQTGPNFPNPYVSLMPPGYNGR
jgi:TP901 family phage tail tape measure protein